MRSSKRQQPDDPPKAIMRLISQKMGLAFVYNEFDRSIVIKSKTSHIRFRPLSDDSDTLTLVLKLGVQVSASKEHQCAIASFEGRTVQVRYRTGFDGPRQALRHAVCLAVAGSDCIDDGDL